MLVVESMVELKPEKRGYARGHHISERVQRVTLAVLDDKGSYHNSLRHF